MTGPLGLLRRPMPMAIMSPSLLFLLSPVANGQAGCLATDSASSGQSLNDRSVKPKGFNRIDQ